jgi:branched-chain amino acid transport system permease protein
MEGFISFLLSIATIVAIYSILTLALNIRWGFTGLLDFGIAGFFAIGAYTSAILTSPPSEELVFGVRHSLGFGVPFLGGLIAAAAAAAMNPSTSTAQRLAAAPSAIRSVSNSRVSSL